eukprot:CAMPEP_0175285872 /NCGR_PEP_ID=MMETSP0093-20121207/53468_1 /TAXON_ID=311494 /ORGANISM="Alexandrium monilatum, Strain CCMP3105" /LENGTH=35 /DNA_ID= /DNA_START= /DNA_END= /DNA_ORIENTATION=
MSEVPHPRAHHAQTAHDLLAGGTEGPAGTGQSAAV